MIFQSTLPLRRATIKTDYATKQYVFQSTLPLRRATHVPKACEYRRSISIHAPLAESDSFFSVVELSMPNFNPRSPCGERRYYSRAITFTYIFQSTLPLRRATRLWDFTEPIDIISIHAPLAESDMVRRYSSGHVLISIHAPLAESDMYGGSLILKAGISIHAPLAESDAYHR